MVVKVDLEAIPKVLLSGTGDVRAFEEDDDVELMGFDLADFNPFDIRERVKGKRAIPVQRESPSGLRWLVMAIRWLSRIFWLIRPAGCFFIFFKGAQHPVDLFFIFKDRVQGKNKLGIIL
jgi:hypothetical protein